MDAPKSSTNARTSLARNLVFRVVPSAFQSTLFTFPHVALICHNVDQMISMQRANCFAFNAIDTPTDHCSFAHTEFPLHHVGVQFIEDKGIDAHLSLFDFRYQNNSKWTERWISCRRIDGYHGSIWCREKYINGYPNRLHVSQDNTKRTYGRTHTCSVYYIVQVVRVLFLFLKVYEIDVPTSNCLFSIRSQMRSEWRLESRNVTKTISLNCHFASEMILFCLLFTTEMIWMFLPN